MFQDLEVDQPEDDDHKPEKQNHQNQPGLLPALAG